MKIKLTTLVVSHRHGTNINAFSTREAADASLDAYCQQWWNDIPGNPDMPESATERIELYFERVESESAVFDDVEVDIESSFDSLAQEALAYEQEAFEGDQDVSGADLVGWFAEWRERLKVALGTA